MTYSRWRFGTNGSVIGHIVISNMLHNVVDVPRLPYLTKSMFTRDYQMLSDNLGLIYGNKTVTYRDFCVTENRFKDSKKC